MKRVLTALVLSGFVFVVQAAEKFSIRDYTDRVFARVVANVSRALEMKDGPVEVSGVVTQVSSEWFFLQGNSGLKVFASGDLPAVGEEVSVSGLPALEGPRVVLEAKTWRHLGLGKLPESREVQLSDLLDPSVEKDGVNWMRVTVHGRAVELSENGFVLKVGDVPMSVSVPDLPDFLTHCDTMRPCVAVTGVAEQVLNPSVLRGRDREVLAVKISCNGPSDIVLEPDLEYLAACHHHLLVVIGVTLLALLALGLLIFVTVVFRQRRRLFRTRTIMAERKRMADDIHDTIEQHLVGAGMLLRVGHAKEAQDVLVRAKRELRDIVWGLKNDDMMRLSPAELIRSLAHDENTKGLYRVDVRLEGLPAALDAAAMRDLSLIVREAIGNAVKHGGAKKIAISSDALADGGWQLRIANDGAPFDPATAPGAAEGHFGLEGMRERARRIGARISFEARKGGTVVVLRREKKQA